MCVSLKGKHTNSLSLRFIDPELETRYSVEKEKQSGAAFCCSCAVLLFTAAMEALIDPWYKYTSTLPHRYTQCLSIFSLLKTEYWRAQHKLNLSNSIVSNENGKSYGTVCYYLLHDRFEFLARNSNME